jgi:hypothetical protein
VHGCVTNRFLAFFFRRKWGVTYQAGGTGSISGCVFFLLLNIRRLGLFSSKLPHLAIRLEPHLGDFFTHLKHLHFSRGWPTNFWVQEYAEREGPNADTRCECVQEDTRSSLPLWCLSSSSWFSVCDLGTLGWFGFHGTLAFLRF